MGNTTINWSVRQIFGELSKEHRWDVLTVMILHANTNGRCWVGMRRLAELATNSNTAAATRAKKWLLEHGAIELVPFDKRMTSPKPKHDETKLPIRQHIYHLTGVIVLDGKMYDYLYTSEPHDENEPDDPAEDSAPTPDVSTCENIDVLPSKILQDKISDTSTKGIAISTFGTKGNAKKEKDTRAEDSAPTPDVSHDVSKPKRQPTQNQLAFQAILDGLNIIAPTADDRSNIGKQVKSLREAYKNYAGQDMTGDDMREYVAYIVARARREGWTHTINSLSTNGRFSDWLSTRSASPAPVVERKKRFGYDDPERSARFIRHALGEGETVEVIARRMLETPDDVRAFMREWGIDELPISEG